MASQLWKWFKYYFGGGLVAIAPLLVTGYIIVFLIRQVDKIFLFLLPQQWEFIVRFPGFSVVATVVIITLTGVVVRNRVGRALQRIVEFIVQKVPLARTIYQAIKQFMVAFVEGEDDRFKRAVAFEYPRKGIYAIGFVTGEAKGILKHDEDVNYLSVFLPTTPNPTSGFYLMVPEKETVPVDASIEDVFRLIISGGIAELEESEKIPRNGDCKNKNKGK